MAAILPDTSAMRHEEDLSVLIVEDDRNIRDGLCELLASRGFGVRSAKDGQEALDLLQSGTRPSLILLDLMLPKVSGWELVKYVHEDPQLRLVPIIVMTAVPSEQAHVIADEVFIKPVDLARLLDAIARILG